MKSILSNSLNPDHVDNRAKECMHYAIPNVWYVGTSFDWMLVHLPYAVTVAPVVPHRDCSEAHLLGHWIDFEQVYAQCGKFSYSSVLDKSMHGLSKNRHACIPEDYWCHTGTVLRLIFYTVGSVLSQCMPKVESCTVLLLDKHMHFWWNTLSTP